MSKVIVLMALIWFSSSHVLHGAEGSFVGAVSNWVAWGAGTAELTGGPHYRQSVIPNESTAVRALVGGFHTMALLNDGTVQCWGRNDWGQCDVPPDLTDVEQVDAGHQYSLALKKDGTVVHWGFAGYDMRPIPSEVTNIVRIAAGYSHCLALRADGRVLAWGWNGWGQINVPAGLNNVVDISAGDSVSAALRADGTVVAWGPAEMRPPAGLASVVQISCGSAHVLALRSDGTVSAWGFSSAAGAINIPAGLKDIIQVDAGLGYSLAVTKTGAVIGWGRGELPLKEYYDQTTIPSLGKVRRVSAGFFHAIAEQADPEPALQMDSDLDGLTDYQEIVWFRTDPSSVDTDGDGYSDGFELAQRSSPLLPAKSPLAARIESQSISYTRDGFHLETANYRSGGSLVLEVSTNLIQWEAQFTIENPALLHEGRTVDGSKTKDLLEKKGS